ncbi:hypothetical protein Ciccas_004516, partial [Cichlidogyrus casuarinus]
MSLLPDSNYLCPRLVDYLLIVGKSQPVFDTETSHEPELLLRLPRANHKDFPLPSECVFFCQPDGCLNQEYQKVVITGTTSFIFALTDKDLGRTRYGICLNFYKKVTSDNQSVLTSLCFLSHHPYFSKFRDLLKTCKELILRGQSILNEIGSQKDIFNLLSQKETPETNVESELLHSIEIWIMRLLAAPVPMPGKTSLNVIQCDGSEELAFASPDKTRLTLIDFPLHLPLELLGAETCLHVLSAVMLEQKVVLQSKDYNALTMCVMALTTLLYPLQYMFPIIPLLPTSLKGAEQILCSPTPFIIGIPTTFLQSKPEFRLPIDVWLIDIDSNKIICSQHMEPLPPLPQPETKNLISHLKNTLTKLKDFNEIDFDNVDVTTRVAMVNFFDSNNTLANFTEHTRTIRLYPRPVVAFQHFSFIRSRNSICPFTRKLIFTQAVEFLSEWSLCPENEVFQRIQAGITDPTLIGDKSKWYSSGLLQIDYNLCEIGPPRLTEDRSSRTDSSVLNLSNFFQVYTLGEWISFLLSDTNDLDHIKSLLNSTHNDSLTDEVLEHYKPYASFQEVKEQARKLARELDMRKFSSQSSRSESASVSRRTSGASSIEDVAVKRKPALRQINRWDSKLKSVRYPDEDSAKLRKKSLLSSGSESFSDQDDSDIWDLQ